MMQEDINTPHPVEPCRPAVRLMLADDHEVTRMGMAALLAGHCGFEVIAQASDGQQALQLCEALRPDIAILDLHMPVLNGLGTARLLQQRLPQVKVVIFTMDERLESLAAAIRSGVLGYVLKNVSRHELCDSLQRVARGEEALDRSLSARLLLRLAERLPPGVAALDPLTPREQQVLDLIAGGCGNRRVGEQLGISAGTVKTHVERIIGKLGAADRTQAVVRGIYLGLIPGRW